MIISTLSAKGLLAAGIPPQETNNLNMSCILLILLPVTLANKCFLVCNVCLNYILKGLH